MINTRGTSQMEPGSTNTITLRGRSHELQLTETHSIQNVLNEQLECLVKKVQALIASNDDMRAKLTKMLSTLHTTAAGS